MFALKKFAAFIAVATVGTTLVITDCTAQTPARPQPTASATSGDIVARMGTVVLRATDLSNLVAALAPDLRKQLAQSNEALQTLARNELLRRAVAAEARAKGLHQRADVQWRLERVQDELLSTSFMNDLARPPADFPGVNDVQKFHQENQGDLRIAAQYRVAQIYIARPAFRDTAAAEVNAVAAGTARLEEIQRLLRAPNAEFAAIARTVSQHGDSAGRGGEIGWLTPAEMIPEIRAVVLKLTPGQVSDMIETAQGWHFIRVLEVTPERPAPLEAVREAIVNTLRLRRAQESERQYLDQLAKRTPPVIETPVLERVRAAIQ